MKRRLSSLLVPLYKLIFVVVLTISIYGLLRDWRNLNVLGVLFIFGWCAVLHFGANHWKRVDLDNGILYISNYLKTIKVPVSEIAKIEASSFWGWQPQTVRVKLKSHTVFGKEIVFVPNGGWLNAKAYADDLRHDLALEIN
jgi:hypothetical protein